MLFNMQNNVPAINPQDIPPIVPSIVLFLLIYLNLFFPINFPVKYAVVSKIPMIIARKSMSKNPVSDSLMSMT